MSSTLVENFEYRHKKFDQSKRFRSDSLSSSSTGDYESIKLEIEKIYENPFHQTVCEKATALNFSAVKNKIKRSLTPDNNDESCIVAPIKRRCLNSFGLAAAGATTAAAAAVPPAAAILPKISDDTLRSICKYHGNMVRKFPKKERTPKDQERRNKNTIACRMSRRVKKLEHIATEEQYKEFSKQTFDIIQQSMRATAYLHELMKLTSCSQIEIEGAEEKAPKSLIVSGKCSETAQQKKPFTIAFLTGNE